MSCQLSLIYDMITDMIMIISYRDIKTVLPLTCSRRPRQGQWPCPPSAGAVDQGQSLPAASPSNWLQDKHRSTGQQVKTTTLPHSVKLTERYQTLSNSHNSIKLFLTHRVLPNSL